MWSVRFNHKNEEYVSVIPKIWYPPPNPKNCESPPEFKISGVLRAHFLIIFKYTAYKAYIDSYCQHIQYNL